MKLEKKKNVTDQRFMTKPPKQSVVKPKDKGKSLPKSQRGPRTQHFCHHYGLQGHTGPNCHNLRALKNQVFRGQEDQEMTKGIGLLSNQEVKLVIPE